MVGRYGHVLTSNHDGADNLAEVLSRLTIVGNRNPDLLEHLLRGWKFRLGI